MLKFYFVVVLSILLANNATSFIINCSVPKSLNNNYLPAADAFKWIYNDWSIRDVTQSQFGPVIDRRWTDFNTTKGNYRLFSNITTIPFSFYSDGNFEIYLHDYSKPTTKWVPILVKQNNGQWKHFNIVINNNTVSIEENGDIIKTIDIHADKIVIKSEENYLWKWHTYAFLEAEHITVEKPSTLVLLPGKRCYTFYASLCRECYLDLKITNSKMNITKTINSSASFSSLRTSWDEYVLCKDIDEKTEVAIFRRNSLHKETGYWALDIRSWVNSGSSNFKTSKPGFICGSLFLALTIIFFF